MGRGIYMMKKLVAWETVNDIRTPQEKKVLFVAIHALMNNV